MEERTVFPKYGTFVEASGRLAEQLRFLAKAVSTDETRYFMNFIYVENSGVVSDTQRLKAVTTDGRRLHIVDPLHELGGLMGMEPGFWKVIRVGPRVVQIAKMREDQGTFPNYKKILERLGEPGHTSKFLGFDMSKSACYQGENYQNMVSLFRSFPEKTVLNFHYLADLSTTPGEPWEVKWTDATWAITFTANEKLAVIMPMQAD